MLTHFRHNSRAYSSATKSGPTTLTDAVVTAAVDVFSNLHSRILRRGSRVSSNGNAIAGSFIVNVINQTTNAYIGSGDSINTLVGTTGYPAAEVDESVTVSATETMTILDWRARSAPAKTSA